MQELQTTQTRDTDLVVSKGKMLEHFLSGRIF